MSEVSVVLHNIRSLHNVGSIFRTSDGAGVKKIYLCGYTPAPQDKLGRTPSGLAKTALGAENNIPWEKITKTANLISRLAKQGYKIWAVEQAEKSVLYSSVRPAGRDKIVLVLGPEVRGLPESILKRCDEILEIPMRGVMVRHAHHPRSIGKGKESLNVSVAFGIVAYQLTADNRKVLSPKS